MINDRMRDIGEFVPQPDDDMLICRCEEISKGEIRKAVHDVSGTDLCKTCKRNRCERAWHISCRT